MTNIPENNKQHTSQYNLRLPNDLKNRIQELAVKNQRSLNGQIVFLLEKVADEKEVTESERCEK